MNNKHPCRDKCSQFEREQCHTCLIQHVEEQEFKLGLAPDDAYVKEGCDGATEFDEAFKGLLDEAFIEVFGVQHCHKKTLISRIRACSLGG